MRKYEKKQVMLKLTQLIGKKIEAITASKKWTSREISEHTGVPENRISEIKHFEKYRKPITKEMFGKFLRGGIVRAFDVNFIELSDTERAYINELIRNIYII